jgi:arabinan endo-1,5-alpha-L-arabinosidase
MNKWFLLFAFCCAASAAAENLYPLPLSDIRVRDPFILADPQSKTYFLYAQCGNRQKNDALGLGVEVYQSKDLAHWSKPTLAFERPLSGFWGGVHIWAPEVHKLGQRYYMFVTFPGRQNGRGTQILSATKPEGPYAIAGEHANTPPDQQSLDGTPWVDADDSQWMVYCHEWSAIGDGTIRAVPMSKDWARRDGESILLFKASQAPWVRAYQPGRNMFVTDGPFLYRTKGKKLLMIWSSFRKGGDYAVGLAESENGTVKGPWVHHDDVLYGEDGGHGMIFRDFKGQLLLALHQPNGNQLERAQLLKLVEKDDRLFVVDE